MLNFAFLKNLPEFVKQDCELLKRRDLQRIDALFEKRKNKGGEGLRILDQVKKTLNSIPDLKEEYEEQFSTVKISPDTKEEASFLLEFLLNKYKSELVQYINDCDSKSLKWLQDALKRSNKSPQSITDRLGVFSKLLPCIVDGSLLDVLKLLSKNGIACFNSTCINVVLREIVLRFLQFKADPRSLAFTEDEIQFYQRMVEIENNTASWLRNVIKEVNSDPNTSKPIKLEGQDARIPADESSRLHQFSFILIVLQALGCSAQQVNIRVGMVFEGEIVFSAERMYTQTTENMRGPLSNNRWKVYEFLAANSKKSFSSKSVKDETYEVEKDEDLCGHVDDHVEISKESNENIAMSKSPLLSFLALFDRPSHVLDSQAEDDDNFYDSILSMLTENNDYSINPLDELLHLNQIEPKDLVGKKRLFDEFSNDDDLQEFLDQFFAESMRDKLDHSPDIDGMMASAFATGEKSILCDRCSSLYLDHCICSKKLREEPNYHHESV